MCGPAAAAVVPYISAAVGVASAVQSFSAGKKADKRSKQALAQNKESSEKALAQQERENNRKNAKKPNVAALLNKNNLATQNETLLAGPQGVDPSTLRLGQNTLLGN